MPLYALYSLVRILVAYAMSLVFALAYGYIAAKSRRAEMILIPLLDILQSIPVLSFLPGVMLAMVALFPSRQLGVELGSIILIFTGQVWNIAFSFYSSLKTVPRDLREAAIIYRFSRVAEIYGAGSAVFDHRAGVEFDDVRGGRMVFPDGVRNVRAGRQGFPFTGAGVVFADGGRQWKYAGDALGSGGDGGGDRVDGPIDLAAGDQLGGQIQV